MTHAQDWTPTERERLEQCACNAALEADIRVVGHQWERFLNALMKSFFPPAPKPRVRRSIPDPFR